MGVAVAMAAVSMAVGSTAGDSTVVGSMVASTAAVFTMGLVTGFTAAIIRATVGTVFPRTATDRRPPEIALGSGAAVAAQETGQLGEARPFLAPVDRRLDLASPFRCQHGAGQLAEFGAQFGFGE